MSAWLNEQASQASYSSLHEVKSSRASLRSLSYGHTTLQVGIARERWQIMSASELIAKRYGQAGLQVWSPGELSCVSALAVHEGQAAATLSLRQDGMEGLFADAQYGAELRHLRASGARIGEFCRFAVDTCVPIVQVLGELAAELVRHAGDVTDLIMETHPRHATFYCALLGFTRLGPVRTCERVGAPGQLLHRSVAVDRPGRISRRAQALLERIARDQRMPVAA